MKKRFHILLSFALLVSSCALDNFDGPNASISGSIKDKETGELIEQDIVSGTQIDYIEFGFKNPVTQYMLFKVNGTYQNDLMFAGEYSIRPNRGNFAPIPLDTIVIKKGKNQVDFTVTPYIRIKNATIKKENNKIVATFNIQQTITNKVNKIGLFAHREPNVGQAMKMVGVEKAIGAVTNEETLYSVEIDLTANSSTLRPGKSYYFRVGALITATDAKYNYAKAIRIDI